MTGFLGKEDLRQLTGAARQGDQVDWLRSEGPNWAALERMQEEAPDDEDGFDGLLIVPTSEVLPIGDRPTGISEPVGGVYALFAANGALNYIGQSCDIAARIIQHANAARRGQRWPFVEYAYVEVCELLVDAVETAHIYALRPPENVKYDIARWDCHDEVVRRLREAWGEKR